MTDSVGLSACLWSPVRVFYSAIRLLLRSLYPHSLELEEAEVQKQMLRKIVNTGIISRLENWMARASLVGDSIFFESKQFPWAAELEANWQVIRKELDEILKYTDHLPNYHDISSRQSNITNDDLWKTYFFCAYGLKAEKNCDRCPKTTQLLENIPGLQVAFFSILAPHKHIPKHRGLYKGVIRYHLGLVVPEPQTDCWIEVGDKVAYWTEGKSLIFDDTFPHQVQNNTDSYRAILFLDVERPLPFPWSAINRFISVAIAASPMIQSAKTNHAQWEKRFETLQQQEHAIADSPSG